VEISSIRLAAGAVKGSSRPLYPYIWRNYDAETAGRLRVDTIFGLFNRVVNSFKEQPERAPSGSQLMVQPLAVALRCLSYCVSVIVASPTCAHPRSVRRLPARGLTALAADSCPCTEVPEWRRGSHVWGASKTLSIASLFLLVFILYQTSMSSLSWRASSHYCYITNTDSRFLLTQQVAFGGVVPSCSAITLMLYLQHTRCTGGLGSSNQ
jgi:hypothetical protein